MVAKSFRDFGWVVCPGRYTHALTFSLSITTSQFGPCAFWTRRQKGGGGLETWFGSLTGYRIMEESQGFEGSCSAVFRRDPATTADTAREKCACVAHSAILAHIAIWVSGNQLRPRPPGRPDRGFQFKGIECMRLKRTHRHLRSPLNLV